MVVDDHRVVRLGLEALLQETDDLEMVGSAANGADACDLASDLHPDVVLMDLSMSEMDGVEATRKILAINPEINIVVLTSFSDRERVLAALDAGATGYQLKDAETETLLNGIRNAAAGHSPLDPRVASKVLASRTGSSNAAQLTAREEQVLRLVGNGLLNKQIARELGISESTVKTHLTSVFQTIGVHDRTQAALWVQSRN
jgi:DNA-binding NarL/FixJ family response regulator